MRAWTKRWSDLSIRYKLFAVFLFVVSVPFALLLSIHLSMTAKESKQQATVSAHKVMEETKAYLEYKAVSIHEVLNFIAFNDVIQEAAANPEPYTDVNLWGTDANRVAKVLHQFRYNQDIEMMQLYMKAGLAGEAGNDDYLKLENVENEQWFIRYATSKATFGWFPSSYFEPDAGAGTISVLRKIPEEHSLAKSSGIVRAQLSQSAMQSVLNHTTFTPNTSVFLLNDQGDLLSTTTSVQFGHQDVEAMLDAHPELIALDTTWDNHVVYEGRSLLVGASPIFGSAMRLVVIVPESDILATTYQARNQLIAIFLLIIPFTLPLSFIVAGSSTKRIRQLTRNMAKVKGGSFYPIQLPANRDEIGELTLSFNDMVNNVSKLMDETYQLGREVKNKELKALQAQINPHFLYNTLDLINVMAIESGERDISTVVDELAVFYKLSLSNGRERVYLDSELKHVEAYVRIQNMRFGGGIALEREVPEELLNCEVPKIMLQPLIENSILHGIREKDSEEGTIKIKAWKDKGDIYVQVEDDGVGMDEKQLANAMTGKSSKGTGGFGVRNIQERIELFFGASYGLTYVSEVGQGTVVTIRLPEVQF
ncbi:cache domain-containing sensor histidine kinase [Cohnella cholangitidis]|uniref:histidine kinase n=1 Tax=Cohnella cholangitidis TaxID=2598458 RepID=A0A7G5BVK5_9BACL|nr:sensor histidine kinase [Cohnella cholangitidis]QMV40989.1 sensor histidine kinase [Cohnella cholangitidis]